MSFYGDAIKAAELAGVDQSAITAKMQESINNWIISNIKWDGFEPASASDIVEYHDIRKSNQNELILKHFPVISISEVIDGCYTDIQKTLVAETDYVFDSETGIIQLIGRGSDILVNENVSGYSVNPYFHPASFIQGFKSVKVSYKYGFSSVPAVIKEIATLLIAKWAKIKDTQADADGLGGATSMRIGDFSQSLDYKFMGVKSEFDDILLPMITRAQAYYNQGV